MNALAIVLEQPERLSLSRLDISPAGVKTWSCRSMERRQYGHGAAALVRANAAFPGMGYPLVPGYESVGHVVEAGPLPVAPGRARLCSRRALFWRGARSVWRRGLARCCAGATPGSARPAPRRTRPSCWRSPRPPTMPSGVAARSGPTASSVMACWAGCWRGIALGGGDRRSSGSVTRSASGGALDYRVIDPCRGPPRLIATINDVSGDAAPRLADRPPRAGRRSRARRLLRRAAVLRVPARFHARGAASASPRNGSRPISPRVCALIESGRSRSTA